MVDDEISQLVDNQNKVEAKFEEAASQKQVKGSFCAGETNTGITGFSGGGQRPVTDPFGPSTAWE